MEKYEKVETLKCLERMMITNLNLHPSDPYMLHTTVKDKFISEAKEFVTKMAINGILKIINEVDDEVYVFDKSKLYIYDYIFSYANIFTMSIEKHRYSALKCNDEQILFMMMRYYILFPSSVQWSVPLDEYTKFYNEGYTIEGFASPLNSMMLLLGGNFCSVYDDDKVFGSIGSFFDADFNGKSVVVNPPFVESLLYDAAVKVTSSLKMSKCRFIFYGPDWQDSKFMKLLDKNKFVTNKKILKKGTYAYTNAITNTTHVATFNSVCFKLSSM